MDDLIDEIMGNPENPNLPSFERIVQIAQTEYLESLIVDASLEELFAESDTASEYLEAVCTLINTLFPENSLDSIREKVRNGN